MNPNFYLSGHFAGVVAISLMLMGCSDHPTESIEGAKSGTATSASNRVRNKPVVVKGFYVGMSRDEATAVIQKHELKPSDSPDGEILFIGSGGRIFFNGGTAREIQFTPGFANTFFGASAWNAEKFVDEFSKGYGVAPFETIPVGDGSSSVWTYYDFDNGSRIVINTSKAVSLVTSPMAEELKFEKGSATKLTVKGFALNMAQEAIEELARTYGLQVIRNETARNEPAIVGDGLLALFDKERKAYEIRFEERLLDDLFGTRGIDPKTFTRLYGEASGIQDWSPVRGGVGQVGWSVQNYEQGYEVVILSSFGKKDLRLKRVTTKTQRRFD